MAADAAAGTRMGERTSTTSPEGNEERGTNGNPTLGKRGGEEGLPKQAQSAWQANPGRLVERLRKQGDEMTRNLMAGIAYKKIQQRQSQQREHVEVPAEVKEGKIKITVPKEIIERNSKSWEFGLVGRFAGARPDLDRIRQWVGQKWKKEVEVIALPKGCVIFNFQNQEDMLGILLKETWYLDGKGLILEKWHEGFDPKSGEAQMIPVWVQVLGLPLQSWDNDVIRSLANAIGKLLAIDGATSNKTRLIQARFCVLIRTDEPVPTSVELDLGGKIWDQELIYETSKVRCQKCGGRGHLPQVCKGREAREKIEKPKKQWVVKKANKEAQENMDLTEEEKEEEGTVNKEEPEKREEETTKDKVEEEIRESQGDRTEGPPAEGKEERSDREEETKRDSEEEGSSEGFERVQTRRSRKKMEEGRMDVGGEERKAGRPTDREKREKEAANQIDLGLQKTLDSIKGKARSRR